jgi:Tfp pilus assembly protein PilX
MSTLPRTPGQRRGGVLIIALLFIVIFSALAAAVAAFSGINVRLGDNQRRLDNVRSCAESGLEITRYWLNKIAFTGTTPAGERVAVTAAKLQDELNWAGVTNIQLVWDATTITFQGPSSSNVLLNSAKQQSFSAVLRQTDADIMRVEITGHSGGISRTLVSNFVFDHRTNSVFDHALATKGPLELSGTVDLVAIDVEANAYIDTDDAKALMLSGSAHISGDVKITSSQAATVVQVSGQKAGIGDAYGPASAFPPYTEYSQPKLEFPEMVPSNFEKYITNTLNPATDTSGTLLLNNVRIPAGMNPSFTGQVTLRGVVYIEAPNVVTFAGSTTICGVIVGNGDPADNSGTNSITFTGSLASAPMNDPVAGLPPEPQFEGIRNETGTFVMAAGFKADFEGPFTTLSGAIAANGITFGGNAGGTIDGSLINYSPTPMVLGGKNDLTFNRTGDDVPAGFVQQTILRYDPSSYSEVL